MNKEISTATGCAILLAVAYVAMSVIAYYAITTLQMYEALI